jgi:hypothetical protein
MLSLEPSLNDLAIFSKREKIAIHSVIKKYLNDVESNGGYYYIGGQIKTFPTDEISKKLVIKAIEGLQSIEESEKKKDLVNLVQIIQLYKTNYKHSIKLI